MALIPRKLTFMAKYGSKADRQKVSHEVDKLLDRGDTEQPGLHWDISSNTSIPLESHQIHRIIDSKDFEGMNHPVSSLTRWHFGDLKDEHWDKIARKNFTDASVMASMPKKHLKTVSETHQNSYFRSLAKNRLASMGPDDDELLKDLKT